MPATALNLQSFYPADLKIIGVKETAQEVVIQMHSISQECTCYKCGAFLIKHHGSHHRNVQDLPILGNRIHMEYKQKSLRTRILYPGFSGDIRKEKYAAPLSFY